MLVSVVKIIYMKLLGTICTTFDFSKLTIKKFETKVRMTIITPLLHYIIQLKYNNYNYSFSVTSY